MKHQIFGILLWILFACVNANATPATDDELSSCYVTITYTDSSDAFQQWVEYTQWVQQRRADAESYRLNYMVLK